MLKKWNYVHGLEPSAMRSNLKELRLTSLWSFVANNPQCRSLDLHIATLAKDKIQNNVRIDLLKTNYHKMNQNGLYWYLQP